MKDKVTGALGIGGGDDDDEGDEDGSGGGGGGNSTGRGKFKFMNIYEVQDVGVPLRVAYDQWTQMADFPSFMKKVETVNQESDEKVVWTAKVFWSRRSWETTIREQVPDSHILWVSSGAKGSADGIVTFSELAPNLTRIVLIMEYYPQGFFEKTGNLWRAVGRRARLEFKHFCRHVMMDTLINREELEGWRGEIRDSEVVKTHEEALEEEQRAAEEDARTPRTPRTASSPTRTSTRTRRRRRRPRGRGRGRRRGRASTSSRTRRTRTSSTTNSTTRPRRTSTTTSRRTPRTRPTPAEEAPAEEDDRPRRRSRRQRTPA